MTTVQQGSRATQRKSIDRAFLAHLLRRATNDLAEKAGSCEITAAALGSHLRDLLRIILTDANVELDGFLFGPVLYPRASPDVYQYLKLRNFLAAFPEIVLLHVNQSGDRVFLLDAGRGDLAEAEKSLSFGPDFPSEGSVPVEKLTPLPDLSMGETNSDSVISPSPLLGFLIVESVSIVQSIHQIFGEKPQPKGLPQWDGPMRWIRSKFPGQMWKALYFMCLDAKQVQGTEGFQSYLKAVGYELIALKLNASGEIVMQEERLMARAKANATAVARGIDDLATRASGPTVIVSHSEIVLQAIDRLLEARGKDANVTLLAIREFLPDSVVQLQSRGLKIADLEHDARAFKITLPRARQLIPAESFDPTQYFKV